MSEQMLVKNAAKCLVCGDVIQSTHRHDYVTCSCGACSVDGGLNYIRRVGDSEDMCIWASEDDHVTKREHLTWGTYGKDGNEPLQRKKIKDLDTEHIRSILLTQLRADVNVIKALSDELIWRKDHEHKE